IRVTVNQLIDLLVVEGGQRRSLRGRTDLFDDCARAGAHARAHDDRCDPRPSLHDSSSYSTLIDGGIMRRVVVLGTVIGVAAVSMVTFGQAPTGPTPRAIEATKIEKVKNNLYIITGSSAGGGPFRGGDTHGVTTSTHAAV